jgi:hypothetical protein
MSVSRPDWSGFLAARLDEWEARVSSPAYCPSPDAPVAYLLADIAAKRAILARCEILSKEAEPHYSRANVVVVEARAVQRDIRDLCRPFADHPDYPREEQ